MNILLVEDEQQLSDVLKTLLEQQRYAVDAVYDGISGEEYALSDIYDLMILDIMLPGQNGLVVLEKIRKAGISVPVLLLTARADVEDKIKGLDLGADDYLTKPFSTGELLARVRAMTRRKGDFVGDELTYHNTTLSKNTYKLTCGDNSVKLGKKEFQIIEMMMQNERQIIPKERFVEKIWGFDSEAEYNTVEVYISFIRKKLTAIGSGMEIKTIRGIGYALEADV